jgi:hypothetical protein
MTRPRILTGAWWDKPADPFWTAIIFVWALLLPAFLFFCGYLIWGRA